MVLKTQWASKWFEELVKNTDSQSPSRETVIQLGWSVALKSVFYLQYHVERTFNKSCSGINVWKRWGRVQRASTPLPPKKCSFPTLFSLSSLQENDNSFSLFSRVLGSAVSGKNVLAISWQSLYRTVFKREGRGGKWGRKEKKKRQLLGKGGRHRAWKSSAFKLEKLKILPSVLHVRGRQTYSIFWDRNPKSFPVGRNSGNERERKKRKKWAGGKLPGSRRQPDNHKTEQHNLGMSSGKDKGSLFQYLWNKKIYIHKNKDLPNAFFGFLPLCKYQLMNSSAQASPSRGRQTVAGS